MVEPTCGVGGFVVAAMQVCQPTQIYAMEQNASYVRAARRAVASTSDQVKIQKQDFFRFQWEKFRDSCGQRVLFFGNPPWVTRSEIGLHSGDNLPKKRSDLSGRGIDAITGKSNFDLAESMLLTLLSVMRPGNDSLAMLVKSSTARRLAQHAWSVGQRFEKLDFYRIDAKEHFDASVEAGLLLLQLVKPASINRTTTRPQVCRLFKNLSAKRCKIGFGYLDEKLVSNPTTAKKTKHLVAPEPVMWRSGIKHDLSRVLELNVHDDQVFDQDGNQVDIESDYLFPLAKGSDVASGVGSKLDRVMLVPQRSIGQSTQHIEQAAPKTHAYLKQNLDLFNSRRSKIYRDRDPFSIFGVGPYTFSPWKVAICGLYKRLTFTVYGPLNKKPVVFDDTVYLLPLQTRRQALLVKRLLESRQSRDFLESRIFWEAKRPINAAVLRSLDLGRVADCEGLENPTPWFSFA